MESSGEASMSEGRLRARVAAWEREQQWAPGDLADALGRTLEDYEDARRKAGLAEADGDRSTAEEWAAKAALAARRAEWMKIVVEARAKWEAHTAVTKAFGERAAAELRARGLAP